MWTSEMSLGVSLFVGAAVFLLLHTLRAEYRLRARYPELYAGLGVGRARANFARLLVLTFRPEWRRHPDPQVRRFVLAYQVLFIAWVGVLCLPLLILRFLTG